MIEKKHIQITDAEFAREDAIRHAAKPLVEDNKISDLYVEAMVKTLETHGTYIVLSKYIAIAHAEPSSEVYEDVIGLCVLNKTVVFGHPTNDPVKYLFVLAAKESSGHIGALQKLALKFMEEDFMKKIDSLKTVDEVYEYLNN